MNNYSNDLYVLNQFTKQKHIYLSVVGDGKLQHLTVTKEDDFRDTNMKKVIGYLENNKGLFEQMDDASKEKVKCTLEEYRKKINLSKNRTTKLESRIGSLIENLLAYLNTEIEYKNQKI